MPARILPRVLFPAPFSPQKAWQDPSATSSVTSSRACTPTNRFVTRSNRTADCVIRRSHFRVLLVEVGEAPHLQLARPLSEVVARDADEVHGNDRRHVLLEVHLVDDRLHA